MKVNPNIYYICRGLLKIYQFDKIKNDLSEVTTTLVGEILPSYVFVIQNLLYLVARSVFVNAEYTTKMHKNLAEHIEFTYASNLPPMFALLDHHWNMAAFPNHSSFFKELTTASMVFPYSFAQKSSMVVQHHNTVERGIDELGKSFTFSRMGVNKKVSFIIFFKINHFYSSMFKYNF